MRFKPLASASLLLCSMLLPSVSQAAPEWKPGVPRTAYVTLFEWSWDSIAKECTNFLGPKGYAAVQVSPPQEHGPGGEWWRRYQPVSYQIVSRSGNRAQFQNMVNTCRNAGVDVYVDTVINHMADYNGGTGTAGSSWSARNFPGVPFSSSDFHSPKCDIANSDYDNNRNNVTFCDMPGLPDLNTGSSYVRGKIAGFMNDLLSLGVAGFRIDAAKHITPADLGAIKAQVPGSYFFTQEVIRDGTVGGAGSGDMAGYQNLGTVNEFNYIYAMKNSFLNLSGFNLNTLPNQFATWGFLPSNQATVFVNNHDTERKLCNGYSTGSVCDSLNTFNGSKLYLANVFMLAYNYGYPTVASGYYFNNHDMGPQGQPYNGTENPPANCSSSLVVGKWDCVHRDRRVANMVGFRNYANGSGVSNWVNGNTNQIAFSRTGKGFVAINNNGTTWQRTFATGLPDGTYCNVLASDNPETGSCTGATVAVSGGNATLSVAPGTAVAIHIGAKPSTNPDTTAPSVPGTPTASNITSSGATLTWTASTDTGGSGLAGYRVFRGATQIGTPTTNSFTDTGASPSTSYTYTIRAIDGAGNLSAASSGVTITTLPGTTNTAKIYYYHASWSSVNIHYGINGSWTAVPGLAMTSLCSQHWTHTINMGSATSVAIAFNTGGTTWDSNNSNNYVVGPGTYLIKNGQITANAANPCTADTTAPTVPSGLTRGTVTSSSVALSWTASTDTGGSGLAGYRVFRGTTQVGTPTGTSFTDTGLSANTTYSYTVRAIDGAGNLSAASTAVSATTLPASDTTAPTVPSNLARGTVTSNSVALTWTASTDTGGSGLAGYRIFRGTTQIGTSTSASYTDTTVAANTTYSYTVRAIDGAGNLSAASAALSVTTPPTSTGTTVTFSVNATTSMGESVYITGDKTVLGNWSTAQDASRKCDPAAYPIWRCTITFPAGTGAIAYKYIKLGLGTKWESGSNRTYTVPASGTVTKDDGSFRP